MWKSFRRNVSSNDYDPKEILELCKSTKLTYLEISTLLDISLGTILRVCSKKAARTAGRPKKLTQEDIDDKVSQVINFYKKKKKAIGPEKLSRLKKHLQQKLKDSTEIRVPKTTTGKAKVPIRRKVAGFKLLEEIFPPISVKLPPRKRVPQRKQKAAEESPNKPRRQTPLELAVEYLIEVFEQSQQGVKYTMRDFAKKKKIEYTNFTRIVKKHGEAAAVMASSHISQLKTLKKEQVYRKHVIEYLAKSASLRNAGKTLSKTEYIITNKLKNSLFMQAFQKYNRVVTDEVLLRYHQLEEERLQKLRQPVGEIESSERGLIEQLEKVAERKLPLRDGVITFASSQKENKRLEELWMRIAGDVYTYGLIDAVAEKWSYDASLQLPQAIPPQDRSRLLLTRLRTVLTQLGFFELYREVTLPRLLERLRPSLRPKRPITVSPEVSFPKKSEPAKPSISYPTPPLREAAPQPPPPPPPPPPLPLRDAPLPSQTEMSDEEWLEREIAKEEMEKRRYSDTLEERVRRRNEGFVITADSAEALTKAQIEELKASGAIYDEGNWLLLTKEDLAQFTPEAVEATILRGWHLPRQPKLLIGIGTIDYTKGWMHKAFNVRLADNATVVSSLISSFQPDALMVYKSSCGQKLFDAFTEASKLNGVPLIVFDRGFSDAILSAERQGLLWFTDAYQKKKSFRRYNPESFNYFEEYDPNYWFYDQNY